MGASRSKERGEGRIGCFVSFLALALLVAVALKLVPVYYSNSGLVDSAEELAGQAALLTLPAMEAKLRAKAGELDIPEAMADGAIAISTTGDKFNGICTIVFDYSRPVDLYGAYTLTIATHKVVTRPYVDSR
jgi:hypothetical protein